MSARLRTTVLVNLAMVVEQANEQVLPAVYLFVGRSLNATPVQLGTLTLCRAMVQTLASPMSGILGDRYDRTLVLASGAFIWGVMTSAMALTVTLKQAMAFAGFNGLGLALLVPCCQSLIADLYPAEQRGRAFGTLQLTASLGGMLGGVFATNMGGLRPAGMDGWRAAFHCIAALSLLMGALALFFAVDPRQTKSNKYSLLPASDVTSLVTDVGAMHTPAAAASADALPPTTAAGPAGSTGASLIDRRKSMTVAGHSKGLSSGSLSFKGNDGPAGVGQQNGGVDVGGGDVAAHSALQHRSNYVSVPVTGKAGEQLLLPHKHDQTYHYSKQQSSLTQQQQQPHKHQQSAFSDHSSSVCPQPRSYSPARSRQGAGGAAVAKEPAGSVVHSKSQSADDVGIDVRGRDKGRKRGVVADIMWMLRIRTFQAIVLQGIVGCFPWQAMVFFTLWLQLNGFNDSTASLLVATFGAGVAGGALIGGSIGDRMAKRLPNNGRIFTAQISVFCGIPLTWLLLKGLPHSRYAAEPAAYALVMFCMGLTCTWAGAGCNSPIFAEIVPDELRSTIYAFDRSFENSIAACAAPVVGLLAEHVFGFTGVLSDAVLRDKILRAHNAAALSSSLLCCMILPWGLCLLFYTFLHWSYPQDRAVARSRVSQLQGGSSGRLNIYHH